MLAACAAVSAVLIGAGILEMSAVASGQPAPGRVTLSMIVGWLLIQAAVRPSGAGKVDEALHRIDAAAHDLSLLTGLLQRVEREPFTSPRLVARARGADDRQRPRSKRVAQAPLARLGARQLVAQPPDASHRPLLLVRSQMAVAIDRWHAAHGPALGEWLRAIGELEALASFATYAYEHPDDPFPSLSDDAAVRSSRPRRSRIR